MKHTAVALATSLAIVAASCSSGGGSGSVETGTLSVEVTDAPFDHSLVADARVSIDLVRMHDSSSEASGWHTVYEGDPVEFNLLDLRNGITRQLVSRTDLPAGRYKQLRLRVSDAHLELTNGNIYSTADDTLTLTSTDTSGFKIRFEPAFEIESGFSSTMLLDFELAHVFKPVPSDDPLNAAIFQLHPGIRIANLSTAGELRGTTTTDSGATLVANASVYVLPPGETDPELAIATTISDANGSWAVIGLPAGMYDVRAVSDLLTAAFPGADVTAGGATLVDLDLD